MLANFDGDNSQLGKSTPIALLDLDRSIVPKRNTSLLYLDERKSDLRRNRNHFRVLDYSELAEHLEK